MMVTWARCEGIGHMPPFRGIGCDPVSNTAQPSMTREWAYQGPKGMMGTMARSASPTEIIAVHERQLGQL